jgi:hypothetical protein
VRIAATSDGARSGAAACRAPHARVRQSHAKRKRTQRGACAVARQRQHAPESSCHAGGGVHLRGGGRGGAQRKGMSHALTASAHGLRAALQQDAAVRGAWSVSRAAVRRTVGSQPRGPGPGSAVQHRQRAAAAPARRACHGKGHRAGVRAAAARPPEACARAPPPARPPPPSPPRRRTGRAATAPTAARRPAKRQDPPHRRWRTTPRRQTRGPPAKA